MIIRLAVASLSLIGAVAYPMAASAQSRPEQRPGQETGSENQASEFSSESSSAVSSSVSSLKHVREALGRPPGKLHESLNRKPTFRVEIRERVPLEMLLGDLNLGTGPAIPGGLYNYEQQQALFPSPGTPGRTQAGGVDLLSIGRSVSNAIANAKHARAASAAREEVRRAIQEYCAEQENASAETIRLCAKALGF